MNWGWYIEFGNFFHGLVIFKHKDCLNCTYFYLNGSVLIRCFISWQKPQHFRSSHISAKYILCITFHYKVGENQSLKNFVVNQILGPGDLAKVRQSFLKYRKIPYKYLLPHHFHVNYVDHLLISTSWKTYDPFPLPGYRTFLVVVVAVGTHGQTRPPHAPSGKEEIGQRDLHSPHRFQAEGSFPMLCPRSACMLLIITEQFFYSCSLQWHNESWICSWLCWAAVLGQRTSCGDRNYTCKWYLID